MRHALRSSVHSLLLPGERKGNEDGAGEELENGSGKEAEFGVVEVAGGEDGNIEDEKEGEEASVADVQEVDCAEHETVYRGEGSAEEAEGDEVAGKGDEESETAE